ncbi:ABC transporter ATP-binding protein [Brevibacillus sp. B_LB10_24]|uniref:ABC transporter ATP-binding protein n=1 Tax=Brevibacillus sp. B_LB10_24 TaxID=3380645 RepID=UPI0038B769C7
MTRQQTEENYLHIANLRKEYKDFLAVDDVSLKINRGEFMTLLGSSGSGKSTTLLAIAGFLEPTSGDILQSGQTILDKPPHQRNIGMVFQQYSLFPHMSIADNIAFPLKMRKLEKSEIQRRVSDMLKLIELDGFGQRRPQELSGGQQQRVALARALVFQPNILLMDEPLAALDKKLRETMQLEIRRLHSQLGLTIIYVTHDQEEALKMSDRIAIFNKGRIEQLGTPLDLYDHPRTRFVAEFLGDSNLFPGRVADRSDQQTVVTDASGQTLLASAKRDCTKGDEVVLMVRPEKVDIETNRDKLTSPNFVEAKVIETVFLGDNYKYKLTSPANQTITVKKQIHMVGERMLSVGDQVYVTWDPENAIVLAS